MQPVCVHRQLLHRASTSRGHVHDKHTSQNVWPLIQSLCARWGLSSVCACVGVFIHTLGNASSLVMTSATCSRFVTRRIVCPPPSSQIRQNRTENTFFDLSLTLCPPQAGAASVSRGTDPAPQGWRRLSQVVGHRRRQVSSTLWPTVTVETGDLHLLIVRGE